MFSYIFSYMAISFYIIAYLFGSINAAMIISKIMGLPSPMTVGSGNPGATNMLRSGGKKAGILTLIFDLLKGLIIVLIARVFHQAPIVLIITGLCAVIGHIFPLFFKFKGGKGVATMIGALLAAATMIGFVFIWVWLLTLALTRISSLSALLACIISPIIAYFTEPKAVAVIIALMSLIVIIRHHENIKRLCLFQEKRIGKKASNKKS